MFRLWAKEIKNNALIRDLTVEDAREDTRTHKIFRALDEVCAAFDLGRPIWLESNVEDFKRTAKTRFTQDSFIETVAFDYLEIQIIEED